MNKVRLNLAVEEGVPELLTELAGSERQRGAYISELVKGGGMKDILVVMTLTSVLDYLESAKKIDAAKAAGQDEYTLKGQVLLNEQIVETLTMVTSGETILASDIIAFCRTRARLDNMWYGAVARENMKKGVG